MSASAAWTALITRGEEVERLLEGFVSQLTVLDFPSFTKLAKKKERKETRTQRLRREKTRGFRTTKINPQDYNIQFDLEDYLHKDKIKEIMNLESLEESLEEILTISGSEMDEMFKCRGASSK